AGENVRRCEVHSWLWLARSRAKRRGAARTLPPAFSRLTSFRYLEYAWSRRRTRGGSSEKGEGEGSSMKRRLLVAAALVLGLGGVAVLTGALTRSEGARVAYPVPHPTVSDFQFIKATTPTQADCAAVGRTCFTPQAIQSAYNVGPLHAAGWNGSG